MQSTPTSNSDRCEAPEECRFDENAVFLNPRISSAYSGFDSFDDYLFERLFGGCKPNRLDSKRRTINRVTRNLYYAYIHGVALIVPLTSGYYTLNGRNPESVDSYKVIKPLFDLLEAIGLVIRKPGNTYSGRATHFIVTDQISQYMGTPADSELLTFEFIDNQELIILKDDSKRYVSFPETDFTSEQRSRLAAYNSLIKCSTLDFENSTLVAPITNNLIYQLNNLGINYSSKDNLTIITIRNGLSPIHTNLSKCHMRIVWDYLAANPEKATELPGFIMLMEQARTSNLNSLRRVFNNTCFENGGRHYGCPIQGLPKEVRRTVTINGKRTVELDFESLHITMLYHQLGLDIPWTPYLHDESDPLRKVAKRVFNTALNASSSDAAIKSVMRVLAFKKKALKKVLQQSNYKGKSLYYSVKNVLDALIQYHPQIASKINTKQGIWLQRLDSDIASEVLSHFTQKGVLVIPIHDSFIIAEEHKEELLSIMQKEYFKKMGKGIRVNYVGS